MLAVVLGRASIEDYDDEIGHGHGRGHEHAIASPISPTDMSGVNGIIKGTKRRVFSFSYPGMKG